jgi:hypothetical protein
MRVETLSGSAKALLPAHKCGGFHHMTGSHGKTFPISKVGKQEVALLVNEVFNKGDFS